MWVKNIYQRIEKLGEKYDVSFINIANLKVSNIFKIDLVLFFT